MEKVKEEPVKDLEVKKKESKVEFPWVKNSTCNICNSSLDDGFKVQSSFRGFMRALCIKCAERKEQSDR